MCKICSQLTIKTPKWYQSRRSSVFIVNFEVFKISHIRLVFSLLTLNQYIPDGYAPKITEYCYMKELNKPKLEVVEIDLGIVLQKCYHRFDITSLWKLLQYCCYKVKNRKFKTSTNSGARKRNLLVSWIFLILIFFNKNAKKNSGTCSFQTTFFNQ